MTMKYKLLSSIKDGESLRYKLAEIIQDYTDGVDFQTFYRAIIKEVETDKYFCVHYWTDAGDHGITPEDDDECKMYEVELKEVVVKQWVAK